MSSAKTLASIAAPAPEVVQEPVQQATQLSSKQRAKIDKGLVETRVERVRVDGLVSPAFPAPRATHSRRAATSAAGCSEETRSRREEVVPMDRPALVPTGVQRGAAELEAAL